MLSHPVRHDAAMADQLPSSEKVGAAAQIRRPDFKAPIAKSSSMSATNPISLQSTRRMRRRRDIVGEFLAHNTTSGMNHTDKASDEHNESGLGADRD